MKATQYLLFSYGAEGAAPGSRPAKLSAKQAAILQALRSSDADTITLAEAVRLVGGNLFANAEKHVGATLATMVRHGMIERVRPGVFRLLNAKGDSSAAADRI